MTRKMSDAEAKRSPLNLRTTAELRRRLDEAAVESGRSITQEVERRLERSFDSPRDPLPGIFSDELRRYLRGQRDIAKFLEALADVSLHVIRAGAERNRSEHDVRTALRAATDVIACWFFWRGEKDLPYPQGPQPALGARLLDMPPAHLGYEIAKDRLVWLARFQEEGVMFDTFESRIMNSYSGNGRETLFGDTPDEAEERRAQVTREANAAFARGDLQYESPENLSKYARVSQTEPSKEDQEPLPPQALKDIMGR